MLEADVDPERAAELVQRQIAVATLGQAHALLAAAAAIGLQGAIPLMSGSAEAAAVRPDR